MRLASSAIRCIRARASLAPNPKFPPKQLPLRKPSPAPRQRSSPRGKTTTMKHVNVLELKDAGDDNDPAAIVTKALADFQATFDGRLKAIETKSSDGKLADRLNSLEAKMNRQGHGTGV